jgi:CRISPR/Cas system CSM-associated protein Csm2 small subunit
MDEKEIKKFKEIFDKCLDDSIKKLDFKKISEDKKENLVSKFKKLIG